jgi:hypothetical protein
MKRPVLVDLFHARKIERIKTEFVVTHNALRVSIRTAIRFRKFEAWYEISLNISCTLCFNSVTTLTAITYTILR